MDEFPLLVLVGLTTADVLLLLLGLLVLFVREPDEETAPAPLLFGPLTPALARALPTTDAGAEGLRKDLLRAGYYAPVAPENFQALRAVLVFFPLLSGLAGSVLVDWPLAGLYALLGAAGGALGFAAPRLCLNFLANQRGEQVRRGLPVLMDTLGLSLSAGASLPDALGESGAAMRRGHPQLARDVSVVCAQARLRSLAHALEQWKDRQPVPELGSFVYLLAQSDRFGTDVTRGLWELSASLQVNARQRAEAAANRTNFYMLFPTVLCLLTAGGLILAGPGLVEVLESNRRVDEILRDAREQQRKLEEEAARRQGGPAAVSPGGR